MADEGMNQVIISSSFSAKLTKWRVCEGQTVKEGNVLAFYEKLGQSDEKKAFITQPKLKSSLNGRVRKFLVSEGEIVQPGKPVAVIEQARICEHKTIMKDLCCDCGADLRKLHGDNDEPSSPTSATISMIHNIPELKVTKDEAEAVGRLDEERLLSTRKLALVVDLDQTLIHTTVQLVPANMKDVQHFVLPGHPMWYHTKFRPWAHKFLQKIAKFYELHIFTMGTRMYAHTIARMLDPDLSLFGYRIRSRDDCFNAFSKFNDLRSLFPCGDSMVCIIDDRADVWNNAPSLIKVKPYQFFKGVGDINAPPDKQDAESTDSNTNADVPGEVDDDIENDEPSESSINAVVPGEVCDGDGALLGTQVATTELTNNSSSSDEKYYKSSMGGGKAVKSDTRTCENDESVVHSESNLVNGSNNNVNSKMTNVDENDVNMTETFPSADGKSDSLRSCETGDDLNLKRLKNETQVSDNAQENEKMVDENVQEEQVQNLKSDQTEQEQNLEIVQKDQVQNPNDGITETKCTDAGVNDVKIEAKDFKQGNNDVTSNDDKKTAIKEKGTEMSQEDQKFAHEDEDEDDYLLHLEEVLEKIHQKFYSTLDELKKSPSEALQRPEITRYCLADGSAPCTKQIIRELRKDVLRGANIVFTGVIPTNLQPEKSEIWQRTLALGARISNQIVTPKDGRKDEVTTHVVAARLGTEKAYRALKAPGIKLVNPMWLSCCEERWEWVDERLFPVEGIEKYKKQIRTQNTPRGTPHYWVSNSKGDVFDGTVASESDNAKPVGGSRSESSSSSTDVLMASIHPLLSFSSTEMEAIDKEVEDLMHSDAEGSDVIGSISGSSSSSSNSLSGSDGEDSADENPPKKKRRSAEKDQDSELDNIFTKKRKKEDKDSEDESDDYTRQSSPSDDDDDDENGDGDDMAALLEAEISNF